MPTTTGKRKRAKKACLPCHQRKRKCNAEYPCSMCTIYEYNCTYSDDGDNTMSAQGTAEHDQPMAKRVDAGNGTSTPGGYRINTPNVTQAGLFDENKNRYAGTSAAMAFPHILGVALGSDGPLKIHSFAYNFGIRGEELSNDHGSLGQLISEDQLASFSRVYFEVLGPIGDFLDSRIHSQRCRDYFHGSSNGSNSIAFGAVAAGVAAVGSFLSSTGHPRESDLVQYAKAILDDPASMRTLGIDHIIAWAMRVFYLRATTRPNSAWIASCTAMHLCEAVGLHEEQNIQKMASLPGATAVGHDVDRLRRLFWVTWAGHTMLSYESDRSCVSIRTVTCQSITPKPDSVADQFVAIAQIIPTPTSHFRLQSQCPATPGEELFERLKALHKLPFTDPFLIITKADLVFCFYRRIYHLKQRMPDDIIQIILDAGNSGVVAAEQLVRQHRLLWNVFGSVFQYACALLAIDTPTSSVYIAPTFQCLENLVKAVDTPLTRKAWSMARHLLSLSIAKKQKELVELEAVERTLDQSSVAQLRSESSAVVPEMDWSAIDWDQLLVEPYLSLLDNDVY